MSDGEWDFYPCRVDDAPASILMDFQFTGGHPNVETLYYAGFEMLDPDEHGMGSAAEAQQLYPIEDVVAAKAAEAGFVYVARLRNNGDWQMTFYADAGKESQLEQIVVEALAGGERRYRTGSQADAEWGYYHDFLKPDLERWVWILDRRVVEQLMEAGDQLSVPRDVDHFVRFASVANRDAFAAAVESESFRVEPSDDEEGGDRPHGLSLHRNDPVELDHIHGVVMQLRELVDKHDGEYDGWGCPVVTG